MKFIARKGAPNIPLALIEAQENDQLIFFCGAGISYPAGLPGFEGLVDGVYANLPAQKDELELQAIKSGFYDRALGLLEGRIQGDAPRPINSVRQEIINQLTIKPDANVKTHKALLELSKTTSGHYRLVTTNVDHCFLLAEPSIEKYIDSAPKLPVPKPHKWNSLVHLHGLIDKESDPDGKHLVFTSGDFGSAYLTERWASKFVTELFVNFTVVFVGYSINDPVIRYMTDAIAAEKRQGGGLFKMSYVIANTTDKKRAASKKEWKAKGVEPVLYVKGSKYHSNLHKSIQAWAAHSRDGLSSKVRIIRTKARLAPILPYDQDESVRQVVDTLRERVDGQDEKISGYPADVFSKLKGSPAPIEWLPVLYDAGLLSISKQNSEVKLIHFEPIRANLLRPNIISEKLWSWLLHHLDKRELINWVIDHGVCLHPDFKDSVKRSIKNNPPVEPYLTFWKILTSEKIRCRRETGSNGYEEVRALIKKPNELAVSEFSQLLKPFYKLSKDISWPGDKENESYIPKTPYRVEISIGLKDGTFKQLSESNKYPNDFSHMVYLAGHSLHEAMDLLAYVDQANEKDDRSQWNIVSIEPHSQNRRFRSIACLIELCRDLWLGLFHDKPQQARELLLLWKHFRYPVFRRLIMNAYTNEAVISGDAAIAYLIEDNGWWLWSPATRRETFRLLNQFWAGISEEVAEQFLLVVIEGPPRELYKSDLSDKEFEFRLDRHRWMMLAKLNSFRRPVFGEAHDLFTKITNKYPDWALSDGDRDEFQSWHTTLIGNESDVTPSYLLSLSVEKRCSLLAEDNPHYGDGRIDVFRSLASENPSDVIKTLDYLYQKKSWPMKIWSAGLVGMANSKDCDWLKISSMVENMPSTLYEKEGWAITWWVSKAVKGLAAHHVDEDEDRLWNIASNLFESNHLITTHMDDSADPVNQAINDPVGIMTETIIDRLSLRAIEAQEGIPRPEPFGLIDRLITGDNFLLGKVIIFSRLLYFYSIEPEWVKEKLLPLLDMNKSNSAKYFWQAYLWNSGISVDLAIDIKTHLLIAVESGKFSGNELSNLVSLIVLSSLEYDGLFKPKELQSAFKSMGREGLNFVAKFMWQRLSEDENGKESYWQHRIMPLIRNNWPKENEFLSADIAMNLALLALQLDSSFEEAVNVLSPMLCPISGRYLVLDAFKKSNSVENTPSAAFKLLALVFSPEDDYNNDLLRELVARFEVADSDLLNKAEFVRIKEYLIMQGS